MKPPISAAARRLCVRVVFIGVSSVPSLHPHAGKPVPDPSREIRCLVRRLGPLFTRERRRSSSKGSVVSSRPSSYAYSGVYPLSSTFQLSGGAFGLTRVWNRTFVVQFVVSVL